MKAIALLLATALVVSGCVGLMPKRRPPSISDGTRPTATSVVGTPSIGISAKEVYGKREPVTLVARDKSECTVSESKFRESSIGERVRCDWKAP